MSIATGRRRGLILDRDGVVNEDTGYVHRVEQCRFVDGIFATTKAFAARGFAVVIATNQSSPQPITAPTIPPRGSAPTAVRTPGASPAPA